MFIRIYKGNRTRFGSELNPDPSGVSFSGSVGGEKISLPPAIGFLSEERDFSSSSLQMSSRFFPPLLFLPLYKPISSLPLAQTAPSSLVRREAVVAARRRRRRGNLDSERTGLKRGRQKDLLLAQIISIKWGERILVVFCDTNPSEGSSGEGKSQTKGHSRGDNADAGRKSNVDEKEDPSLSVLSTKSKSRRRKTSHNLHIASNYEAAESLGSDSDATELETVQESKVGTVMSFSGKQKALFCSYNFDAFLEFNDGQNKVDITNEANENKSEEDVNGEITFSGKKKSSNSFKRTTKTNLSVPVNFGTGVTEEDDCVAAMVQPRNKLDVMVNTNCEEKEVVTYTSKMGEKNTTKTGKMAHEGKDIEVLGLKCRELRCKNVPDEKVECYPEVVVNGAVAEKNGLTSVSLDKVKSYPEVVANVAVAEKKEAEVEIGESATAKKKKKKREKEKEKKAAVAAAVATASAAETNEDKPEDVKRKVSEKKVSKHVRDMQEALAWRKEIEEKKKREEEEKLRREEEEQKRQEELERLVEEAKRQKKEKEKEKLLKKKQEGKLLTAKQKEEARRLEAMRNQFLANGTVPSSDSATKRPKYEKKKPKSGPNKVDGASAEMAVKTSEYEASEEGICDGGQIIFVEKADEESFPRKAEEVVDVNLNEADKERSEEDDWDAKLWNDEAVVLPVMGAFEDEDEDEEEEKRPVVTKLLGSKRVRPSVATNSVPTMPWCPAEAIAPSKNASLPLSSKIGGSKSGENDIENLKRKETIEEASEMSNVVTDEAPEQMSCPGKLRSPICCILGHVDTGKTKLLDCIRRSNVQEGEAGGITQQIGATYIPAEKIRERTRELKADAKLQVPGLLVIDTLGHESFANLRSRGSGLCDIAILVVDMMHGLEPQTIESLNLLKMRNTEFIIALNKVDRLYGWKTCPNAPIVKSIKQQSTDVQNEFKMRVNQIITQFMEQGLNTELYYRNKEMGQTYNIVPTSAITGEGISDLLLLLVQRTQKTMKQKLMFVREVQCTVLEVEVVPGQGTTIDVVLVNGVLHVGDQIVVCGMQGPIVTIIRALLTPHPMHELWVKGGLQMHDKLQAAQGIKVAAQGLEHAVAGIGLYVVGPDDDIEKIKETAFHDMDSVMSKIEKSGEGVWVQASTLGSLEALLEFLKSPAVKIPVSGISIGPVHKKDVMKASIMLERRKKYATILAFDVRVTPEARELANEMGVTIFCADIIYHLFDQFKAYIRTLNEEKKKEAAEEAVFPCVLKIIPNCIFNKKDPIVLGVDILEGLVKVGTPICIPSRDFIDIGQIASIEINHREAEVAKKGQKVAIKIVGNNPEEQQRMFGRHFEIGDELVSCISRRSIDVLKANYREELSSEEWKLLVKLKALFKIR